MITTLDKIRWRKELDQRGHEKNRMSPELSEALRNEIRTTLEAGGGPFDVNVARRVYDLSIAASDMCAATTDTEIDENVMRRWLTKRDQERNPMSPELSEALRNEIRNALEAGGGPFDINVARRVYDLAIAARDMCVAATGTVKEAIDQIKDTSGPMETLDSPDTPESAMQVAESFGARLLRELMATLPMLQARPIGDDPKQIVHALSEARRSGMHDVAEQLEVKLFGCVLSGPRQVTAEEIEVVEGSFEHGFADGHAGALPVSAEGEYHVGYLKGTTEKYLDKGVNDYSAAIAEDIRLGWTSQQIRHHPDLYSRTPEMQARYDAAVERERHAFEPFAVPDKPFLSDYVELLQRAEASAEADRKAASMNVMNDCREIASSPLQENNGHSSRYDDTELRGRPSNRVPMDPIEREELEGK
jgi:hypothetical protein